MRRERKIVGRYYRLSPNKRMDLIITNYDCFPAMCKDYERELSEWLKDSKEKARRAVTLKVRLISKLQRNIIFQIWDFAMHELISDSLNRHIPLPVCVGYVIIKKQTILNATECYMF